MTHKTPYVAALAIMLGMAHVAFAQQAPLDGSRPPTISVAEASRSSGMPTSSAAVEIPTPGLPVPQVGVGSSAGVLADVVAPMPQPKPRRTFKAPPATLQVEAGRNNTFAIAIGHINRIVTPFEKPELVTTSTATTMVQGSIVYVASTMEEPIGLFIMDPSAPEMAISLTLVPDAIEPVSTTIQLSGWTGANRNVRKTADPAGALAFEAVHPYLETLTSVMKDVARGRLPDGYGIEDVSERAYRMEPSCSMPGIHVRPMQVLQGSGLQVIVAKATNVGPSAAEVDESLCKGGGLRASAAWPVTTLHHGESTELYLVVSPRQEIDAGSARPTVLGDR